MKYKASFHSDAAAEFLEAIDYYESKSPSAGLDFIVDVELALDSIIRFPKASSLIRGQVRKKPLSKFPFSLIYAIGQGSVRILAVAHHRKRPFYWRGRR